MVFAFLGTVGTALERHAIDHLTTHQAEISKDTQFTDEFLLLVGVKFLVRLKLTTNRITAVVMLMSGSQVGRVWRSRWAWQMMMMMTDGAR